MRRVYPAFQVSGWIGATARESGWQKCHPLTRVKYDGVCLLSYVCIYTFSHNLYLFTFIYKFEENLIEGCMKKTLLVDVI